MLERSDEQLPRLTESNLGITFPLNWYYRASHAMKTLSLKLPDELDARLGAMADRQGASKSALVRSALKAYLARVDEPAPTSALDLAGDLVGAFDGPEDLSYADRFMDGYGA